MPEAEASLQQHITIHTIDMIAITQRSRRSRSSMLANERHRFAKMTEGTHKGRFLDYQRKKSALLSIESCIIIDLRLYIAITDYHASIDELRKNYFYDV